MSILSSLDSKKTETRSDSGASGGTGGAGKKREPEPSPSLFDQIREVCESLAVALFLAFLFKTFEAEAYVIPTGSMAPTL
ncbi:MAG: S26 family signal peptidase, partial [Thermoguttaceae bacterium]|nr:S26 family signal peptidase [Thermoguttaceae bacterium]